MLGIARAGLATPCSLHWSHETEVLPESGLPSHNVPHLFRAGLAEICLCVGDFPRKGKSQQVRPLKGESQQTPSARRRTMSAVI